MDNLSIVSVWTNKETLSSILLPCIKPNVEVLLIEGHPNANLAKIYNTAMRKSNNNFVLFVHSDVEFSTRLLGNAMKMIKQSDVGAVGFIGVKGPGQYVNSTKIKEPVNVKTLDSCVILVDKSKGFCFDEVVFDGLHLCVEDFCCQVGHDNFRCVVIPGDKFLHHSETWKSRGCNWGDYPKYRRLLQKKWGKVPTT